MERLEKKEGNNQRLFALIQRRPPLQFNNTLVIDKLQFNYSITTI